MRSGSESETDLSNGLFPGRLRCTQLLVNFLAMTARLWTCSQSTAEGNDRVVEGASTSGVASEVFGRWRGENPEQELTGQELAGHKVATFFADPDKCSSL